MLQKGNLLGEKSVLPVRKIRNEFYKKNLLKFLYLLLLFV